MAKGQGNFEKASVEEINAAIDVTATKIRDLRSNKKNMAEIALEVKQLVTLRRLLKEKVEGKAEGEEHSENRNAPVETHADITPEDVRPVDTKVEVEEVKPAAASPIEIEEAKPQATETPVVAAVSDNASSKKISELEAELAKLTTKLGQESQKKTSLEDELNRQIQKYDIEITTSNNMQQRLQNDMKKLVQDKLELERSLKQAKETHAEAITAADAALKATQDDLAKESQSFFLLKAAEAESQKQVASLKDQLHETSDKLSQVQQELDAAREQAREQDALLQQTQRELEREKLRFDMELDAEKKLQSRLQQDARRYSLERQTSVDQLKESVSEAEKLQVDLADALLSKRGVEDSLVRLKAEQETSQSLLKTLAKDCQDQKAELERYGQAQAAWLQEKAKLEAHVATHDEVKDKLAALQAHNDSLQSSIEETTAASQSLEEKLAHLHESRAALAAEKEELLHHVTKSEQDLIQLAHIQNENEELQRSINDMSKASDNLHDKINHFKLTAAQLADEKAALLHHAAANQVHEATVAHLQRENAQLLAAVSDKSNAVADMAKAVQVAQSKLQDTQYMTTTEMLKVASLEKHVVQIRQELDDAAAQHKKTLASKEAECKKAVSDMQTAQAELNQLKRAADKSTGSVAAKEDELKVAKATVAALRADVATAKAAATTAEQTLKTLQAELKGSAKADKDEAARLRKENGKLSDVIAQLRKDTAAVSDASVAVQSLETQRMVLLALLVALVAAVLSQLVL
ncbi:Aste57867_12908 [Aphanomyces stellatus]|uniref:Aste57867_12908 protein n=1 Tax=Aphanomyces stellatus TaxID=120398 RepID=A0A485KX92_9STRA|nr:hypothetical protein As57867_012860 [Aphanomyces stellatus]VFT89755.1 Aste57867_12908 [Aphanomyces stellatus]